MAAANRASYRWILEWTNELVLEYGYRFPIATTPPCIRAAHSILPAARAFAFRIPDEEPIYFPLCSVAVADRLLILRDGQVQAEGPRDAVIAALQTPRPAPMPPAPEPSALAA